MKRNVFILFLSVLIGSWPLIGFSAGPVVNASDGLRDVKSPVPFPSDFRYLLLIVIGVLILGSVVFAYSRRKRKSKTRPLPVADTRAPWEIAYEQLQKLSQSSYLTQGRFKEYYSELSGIIRYYFENRFNIRAPEMTTEEFLWSLERSGDLKTEHQETLKKFMVSCDIIKFAKHIPRIEEAHESFRFARQLVDETKIHDAI
ncbi:MAG TPA: hypothetical protein PKV41_03675 [Candidatus Omnitrophota bacterium]|nr:hypothetical protein [Candidatus Omnitrophota bacterium]